MSNTRKESIALLLVCLVMGGYVIIASQQFPQAHGSQGFGQGPGFYPQVLAWSMVILGILNFLGGLKKASVKKPEISGPVDPVPVEEPKYVLVGAVFALTVVATILIYYLGFFMAGFGLVFGSVLLIRPGFKPLSLIRDAIFSAAMVVTVYLVFEVFISIQLPRGLFFE